MTLFVTDIILRKPDLKRQSITEFRYQLGSGLASRVVCTPPTFPATFSTGMPWLSITNTVHAEKALQCLVPSEKGVLWNHELPTTS